MGVYGDQVGLDLKVGLSLQVGLDLKVGLSLQVGLDLSGGSGGVSQSLGKTNGVGGNHVTQLGKNIKFYYDVKMNSDILWTRI